MADVNLLLGVDDKQLVQALKRDVALLDDVQDEANKATRTMTTGFNSSAKAVDKTNSQLRKTEQQLGRTTKAQSKLRGQIRQGALALRGFGAFAALTGVIEGVKALTKAWDDYKFATDAAFALTKRTNDALKGSIGTFIEQKSASDGLFESLKNTNQGTQEYNNIIDKLVDTYPSLTSEQLNYKSSLDDIEAAQRAVNAAIIDNIVAEQQARIFRDLAEELANASLAQEKLNELAAETNDVFTTVNNLFGIPTADNFAETTNKRVGVLTEQINNIDQVGETLRGTFENLSEGVLADLSGGFNNTTAAIEETTKAATKQVSTTTGPLANSLAGLEAQLSAVNKQLREQVEIGATDELMPLIEQQSMLKMAIEDAQEAIKELTGEAAAERVKIAEQLTRDLLLTERDRLELQAVQQAQANEEQINAIIENEEQKARLLEANTVQLNSRLLEIDEQFANEQIQLNKDTDAKILQEKEATLNASIAQQQAELKAVQAGEILRLKQAGATEEQLTALQSEQEQQRQILALETEKKKLEFALEFGQLRTEAEVQTTRALIAAINSEIESIGIDTVGESSTDNSLLAKLGLSQEEFDALKQGVSLAVSELGRLFDARAEFARQAVELRNENISNLREDLALQLQLNEQGFASNVQGVQNQLAEEQKARDAALEKQRKAQQAQVALETVTQASSLITASANIFQSLSAAGPIGIGIAVATIATMFGAFAASKAKAFEAARLYDGGLIPRGRDDKYGDGYRVEGTNLRVGGGEFVVNRRDTREQYQLIKAINKGKFRGTDLMSILDGQAASEGVNLTVIQAEQREQQRNDKMYREAIEQQTKELSKGLNRLYKRADVFPTKDGRMEVRRTENSIITTKIIEKNGN